MRKRFVALMALIAALLCMVGILIVSSRNTKREESQLPIDHRLVAANTGFGFKLLKELVQQDSDQNVFISPASVALSLSMTYNGAASSTKDAMARVLGIQELSLDNLNNANAALLSNLQAPGPGVKIALANSLWARNGVSFHQSFLDRNRRFYGADVTSMDFGAPDARDTINAWVSDRTGGRIQSLVDRIDAADVLLLVNAIHFKGEWTDKFDKANTRGRPFRLQNRKKIIIPMMSREATLQIYKGQKFTAVALPYGKGRISFYIFLPDEDSSLEAFYKELTAENWKTWMSGFREHHEGHITMPRFKVEYGVSLVETLSALGMQQAFGPGADFGRMCDRDVFVGDVVHKTFLEVNEEGTEAAGATETSMKMIGIDFEGIIVVDRPFMYAIRDDKTGELLFLGAVVDPR